MDEGLKFAGQLVPASFLHHAHTHTKQARRAANPLAPPERVLSIQLLEVAYLDRMCPKEGTPDFQPLGFLAIVNGVVKGVNN